VNNDTNDRSPQLFQMETLPVFNPGLTTIRAKLYREMTDEFYRLTQSLDRFPEWEEGSRDGWKDLMVEVLLSVGDFPHQIIPITFRD
jgi:hypothetical protein